MKIPCIRVLSQDLQLLGEIDIYTSLQYTRSWQSVGDFELHTPDSRWLNILIEGNLIMLDNDGHRAGIIRSVTAVTNQNGLEITVTGQTLDGLTSQRCTVPVADDYNGGYDNVPALQSADDNPDPVAAETILKTYVLRHMVNPADKTRIIPNLVITADKVRGMSTVWMSRYDQLDTLLQSISEYTDVGWEIYIDLTNKQLVFDCVPGIDRSINQADNSRVILATQYESIMDLTYAHDVNNYHNLAYAGGAGDGADRTVLKVTNEDTMPQGYDLYETFIDCGSLEVTETDTALSLTEEAKHKLSDYTKTESLTATIAPSGSFVYRQDWDIGDLVTIMDRTISVQTDRRITSVTERYEANSYGLDVVFGTAPKHLERAIRSLKGAIR